MLHDYVLEFSNVAVSFSRFIVEKDSIVVYCGLTQAHHTVVISTHMQ